MVIKHKTKTYDYDTCNKSDTAYAVDKLRNKSALYRTTGHFIVQQRYRLKSVSNKLWGLLRELRSDARQELHASIDEAASEAASAAQVGYVD